MWNTNSALCLGGMHHIFFCQGFSSFFSDNDAPSRARPPQRSLIRRFVPPAVVASNVRGRKEQNRSTRRRLWLPSLRRGSSAATAVLAVCDSEPTPDLRERAACECSRPFGPSPGTPRRWLRLSMQDRAYRSPPTTEPVRESASLQRHFPSSPTAKVPSVRPCRASRDTACS